MPTALARLQEGLFQRSRSMQPPWGPVLRTLRYPVAIGRDWVTGEISVRAMSLAYTTLLSLVPLLVFGLAILKGIGARMDLHFILMEFFRPLGAAANQLTDSVLQFVSNMRGDLLGSIGLIFLTYTGISTIQKIEASVNFVWRVDRPRGWARRFIEYLGIMIIGPILLAVALGLLGSALHSSAAQWLASNAHLGWLMHGIGRLFPYVLITVVFTFMYAYIPNTRVEFRPALIGGVTAGIIWAVVGQVFTAFILYSSQMMAVYTGFAIVLTTLVWVYLSWVILLIGAELAFYVQFPQYLPHGRESIHLTGSVREHLALSVMYLIARDHAQGGTHWNAKRLIAELDMPGASLAPVIGSLERAGLIVATESETFRPARDPKDIQIASIIEAMRAPESGGLLAPAGRAAGPAARVMSEVDAALKQSLGDRSLEELITAE
jgi:membrane protein